MTDDLGDALNNICDGEMDWSPQSSALKLPDFLRNTGAGSYEAMPPVPPALLSFHSAESEVGRLWMKDGTLYFDGNLDESAQVLFEVTAAILNESVQSAVFAEREVCARQGAVGEFSIGQRVRKAGGKFQHTGTIVSAFTTTAGKPRVVLEFDAPIAGMLHVYRPDQLEVIE